MSAADLMTVADLYSQPPLMRLWPDFGKRVCQMAESTTYQLANENKLPVETIRLGRKQMVRTADVLAWLHLPATPANSDAAGGATPAASDENDKSAAKQTGANS
jgi:predicted DNA-binding transcriptional regulator AlpA